MIMEKDMAYKDIREWLTVLEEEQELHRITAEVDWNLEISEILRRSLAKRGPAVLFENIRGYRDGWCTRLFANGLGNRQRLALMFGMPKDTSHGQLIQLLRERIKTPIKPVEVPTGPVKENIINAEDIDIFKLPVPLWHEFDGGRYINTWCGVVTKDPDTGEHNVGTYRGMMLDKNRIAVVLIATQDWGKHYAKYKTRNEPMSVAVVYGCEPSFVFAASTPFRGNEYEICGAIRQEPIELTQCETSDLLVPANAEIVLEGTISPNPETYAMEGPFGEFQGVYGGFPRRRPVIQVNQITHRDNPIFRGNIEGMKQGAVNETGMCAYIGYSAVLWDVLESQGHHVLDLVTAPWAIIKIHKSYEGQARHIAAAIWGSKMISLTMKTVVVVEENVDIRNLREVQLVIHNFADPAKDFITFPMNVGSPGDPALSEEDQDEMAWGTALQTHLLIDATVDWRTHPIRPEWGGRRTPPDATTNPPHIVEKVTQRWKEYGFDD